jgi:hypothetical protein
MGNESRPAAAIFPAGLLTAAILNGIFIIYASNQKFGSPGSGPMLLGLFVSCFLTPVLAIVGAISVGVALYAQRPSRLLWLATAIAAGSGIYLLVSIQHSR